MKKKIDAIDGQCTSGSHFGEMCLLRHQVHRLCSAHAEKTSEVYALSKKLLWETVLKYASPLKVQRFLYRIFTENNGENIMDKDDQWDVLDEKINILNAKEYNITAISSLITERIINRFKKDDVEDFTIVDHSPRGLPTLLCKVSTDSSSDIAQISPFNVLQQSIFIDRTNTHEKAITEEKANDIDVSTAAHVTL